jgi:hypothetical protein
MRLTIIREDNAVIVNGERYTVDCSGLPANFHALQWAGEDGEVEYSLVQCAHCGTRSKKPNEQVRDFARWQPYVDQWYAMKVRDRQRRPQMLPDPKIKCPATAFARSCREIVAECDCPKFVSIRGRDPQTGADVDRAGCVDSFLPLLLIEGAQMSRQAGAAVESLRNEIMKMEATAADVRQEAMAHLLGFRT